MAGFNTMSDDQQSVERETQTSHKETKLIDSATQTENNLQEAVMRYIGTNVDTGEREYDMIV